MSIARESERQRRRGQLLEAAGRVFARKPFYEATMQDVAGEARIGMQALYEHFPSKQFLYEEVMRGRAEAFQRRADAALAAAAAGSGPLERIRVLALVYAETFQDRPASLPLFIHDRVQFDWNLDTRLQAQLRAVYQAERARLAELVREALALGQLRPLDPEFLAQLAMDVLQASLHHAHTRAKGESAAESVARAMDCLLRGVAAGAESCKAR
jgi:AcrR family transcriptional regulator